MHDHNDRRVAAGLPVVQYFGKCVDNDIIYLYIVNAITLYYKYIDDIAFTTPSVGQLLCWYFLTRCDAGRWPFVRMWAVRNERFVGFRSRLAD